MSKAENPTGIRASCREALNEFIQDMGKEIVPWYEREAHKHYRLWHWLFWISILSGFLASLLALLVKEGILVTDEGNLKNLAPVIALILPSVGSAAALILNQFQCRELEDVRERGRIEAQDILDWALGQAAAANTEEKCLVIYEELRKRVTELERAQHREFTKITHPQKSRKTGS